MIKISISPELYQWWYKLFRLSKCYKGYFAYCRAGGFEPFSKRDYSQFDFWKIDFGYYMDLAFYKKQSFIPTMNYEL